MKKIILTGLAFTFMAAAASNTFHVTFDSDAWIGNSEVKAGSYKIQMEGDKAILKSGKNVIEVPAKIENSEHRFQSNGVVTKTVENKKKVDEIQLGGTNERIVFSTPTSAGGE